MKKVRVFAPASIANMGCGFDVIGLALDEVGDILEIAFGSRTVKAEVVNVAEVIKKDDAPLLYKIIEE